jgi:hypothetical protein
MHTDIIEVVLDPKEVTRLLDEIHLLKSDLLVDNKNNILLTLRGVMESCSNFIRAAMNAGIVDLWVSRICQKDLCEEGRFKQVTNAFCRYLYLGLNYNGLFGLDLRQIVDIGLFKILISAIETKSYLADIELSRSRCHSNLSGSRHPSHT